MTVPTTTRETYRLLMDWHHDPAGSLVRLDDASAAGLRRLGVVADSEEQVAARAAAEAERLAAEQEEAKDRAERVRVGVQAALNAGLHPRVVQEEVRHARAHARQVDDALVIAQGRERRALQELDAARKAMATPKAAQSHARARMERAEGRQRLVDDFSPEVLDWFIDQDEQEQARRPSPTPIATRAQKAAEQGRLERERQSVLPQPGIANVGSAA